MSARPPDLAPPGRTFFDQGLFLLHLNKGKEEMRRGQWDEARRELQQARQFRPHDPEAVSNLSFCLFHLGHYEEAETMTRELIGTHPDSVPLLFNLGLILFKTQRDAEARPLLTRVLELSRGHRKAHLTLGLIEQRSGSRDEAQRHFKLAGATLRAGFDADDTIARAARTASESRPKAQPKPGEEAATAPIVKPEPMNEVAIQQSALKVVEQITKTRISVPKAAEPAPPASSPGAAAEQRMPAPMGPFAPQEGGFLSAECRGGLVVRRGVLTGRSGAPVFEPDTTLAGPLANLLVKASGDGKLLLVERGRRPFLLPLSEEFLSVEPGRLLAFEASLRFREDPTFEFRRHIAVPFLKLFGKGTVALGVVSEPARFVVTPDGPLTIAARSVLAYGGETQPELLEEADPLAAFGSGPVFRFLGSGFVLADAS